MPEPVGRPTVMTEEVLRKLDEAFSNGASDREACFLAGISKTALYEYQEVNLDYADRKADLKDMIKYQAKRVIKDKIYARDIDTAKWYVERKVKEEFSLKTENELSTKDDKPLNIQWTSPSPIHQDPFSSTSTTTSNDGTSS